MGSRLRENPSRLLECWCEVVAPQGESQPPWIIQKFPSTYSKEELLKSVPQFTFPCDFQKTVVQHFSFVLTDIDSKFTYGFCRHAPHSDTAQVVLSYLPWHEVFYKLLNHCSELLSSERSGDLWTCLQNVYQTPIPTPGTEMRVTYSDKIFMAKCPKHFSLPSIPENKNLAEYYSAIDFNNMMTVFASMLHERRIIVKSERLSRLSACVQAANSFLYPMHWQHVFIPVLPQTLVDYLSAPMPFLIGASPLLLEKVNPADIGEVVILDADNNRVHTPFKDLETLPDEVTITLRRSLKATNNMLGDSVARAFLRALVHLIGNYREALQFREDDKKITFNEAKFIASRPPHFQPFVQEMLELQFFRQFIDERLDLLNSGKQQSDDFELELSLFCEKMPFKMKDFLLKPLINAKKKAKPSVKSVAKAGKAVKEKSHKKVKDIMKGKSKDSPSKYASSSKTSSKSSIDYSPRTAYSKSSFIDSRAEEAKEITVISPVLSDDLETPSPQTIDLIGELEEELNTRLDNVGPQYLTQHLSSSCSSDTSSIDSSTASINNASGDKSQSSSSSLTLTSNHKFSTLTSTQSANTPSLQDTKEGSGQDLIYLHGPQDEIFDPLLSKDLPTPQPPLDDTPPPIPARNHSRGHALANSRSSSAIPGMHTSFQTSKSATNPQHPPRLVPSVNSHVSVMARVLAIDKLGVPTEPSRRASHFNALNQDKSLSDYRPLSSISGCEKASLGAHNPLYNDHVPLASTKKVNQISTRSNNEAAKFASSLITGNSRFEAPLTSSQNSNLNNPTKVHKNLLGDFSSEFQKLTVNSTSSIPLEKNHKSIYGKNANNPTNSTKNTGNTNWTMFE